MPGTAAGPFIQEENVLDWRCPWRGTRAWIGLLDKHSIKGHEVIILGVILLIVGYVTGISIVYSIGGLLLLVGVILWILGAVGRPVGGRKVWF